MRSLRNVIPGLLVLSLSLSFLPAAFAEKGHEDDAAFVKLLSDSATALQASNSTLTADMTAFAKEEADEAKGIKEPERTEAEKMVRRQAHLKLLRDSAAALQTSRPQLAADLTKTVAAKEKRMAEKMAEMKK